MNDSNYLNNCLKYIAKVIAIIILLNIFVYGQIGPGIGAGNVDAKEVVRAASQALAKTQNIKYKATYQGTGAFSTHSPSVSGTVTIEKLAPDNQLKAKFAANGQFFQTGSEEKQEFHTTFDGSTINRLRSKESAVIQKKLDVNNPTERKLGFVTSFFGGGPYQLIMFELIENEPLKFQSQSTVFDYEGRAIVENILCHVVYLEYLRAEKLFRERWYFGVNDYLPRRYEQLATDDKGRHGAYVLTLSDLQINRKFSDSAFKFVVPKGYAVKPYQPPTRPNLLPLDSTAPDWKLSDAMNREHSLTDYRGKIVVMDFWATWCGPCIKAMPDLQKLSAKLKSRGVEVIGINVWEESNAALYVKDRGFTYKQFFNGEEAAEAYQVVDLPTLYIIGTDGKIIYRTIGSHKDVETVLEQYLKKVEVK